MYELRVDFFFFFVKLSRVLLWNYACRRATFVALRLTFAVWWSVFSLVFGVIVCVRVGWIKLWEFLFRIITFGREGLCPSYRRYPIIYDKRADTYVNGAPILKPLFPPPPAGPPHDHHSRARWILVEKFQAIFCSRLPFCSVLPLSLSLLSFRPFFERRLTNFQFFFREKRKIIKRQKKWRRKRGGKVEIMVIARGSGILTKAIKGTRYFLVDFSFRSLVFLFVERR